MKQGKMPKKNENSITYKIKKGMIAADVKQFVGELVKTAPDLVEYVGQLEGSEYDVVTVSMYFFHKPEGDTKQ